MSNYTKNAQKINIFFDPDTFKILHIFNDTLGEYICNDKILQINADVYTWAKSIKPAPNEFGSLSSFLVSVKHRNPDGIKYKFTNNGNFLNEYLLGTDTNTDTNTNKIDKYFEIQYLQDNSYSNIQTDTTADIYNSNSNSILRNKYHIIAIYISILKLHSLDYINNNWCTSTNNSNILLSQLRHELINPLNIIKLSGDQIRQHIRQINTVESPISTTDINKFNKFNNIILSEVDNSIDIIDTLTSNKPQLFEKISLIQFKTYIQCQLDKINQTYFMYSPTKINWENQYIDTNYIITRYVYLNTNYMKIILDNIFKNIYGHVSQNLITTTNTQKNESFNKFVIQFNNNEIHIKISNQNKLIKLDIGKYQNNQSYKTIIDKYDLDIPVNYQNRSLICKFQDIAQSKNSKNNNNNGIGITLISNLCQKMNFKWNLIDNESEICFVLRIPVLSDTKTLGYFHNSIPVNNIKHVECIL